VRTTDRTSTPWRRTLPGSIPPMRYWFLCVVLAASACSAESGLPTTQVTSPPDTSASTSTTTTVPTNTDPTTTLPALPDTAGELSWFAPLPPLPTGPGRPFIGSSDFMGLFIPNADWSVAASHLQVFKLYGEWVAYGATDQQLATAIADIRRRGLLLAVEAGPLDPQGCGSGIESFAGSDEGRLIADRIAKAGGVLDLIALDEPYYFGSIYDAPNACHWSAEKVAAEVGRYIDLMGSRFPDVVVGDTEPTPHPVQVSTYSEWLETFRAVNGYDLAFLHLDVDWSRTEWPSMVEELVAFGNEFGVPVGMIYIGNAADPSDQVDIEVMGERVLRLEDENGVHPVHILFQSWVDHPDHVLPESEPYTFTGFIRAYYEDRSLLGFTSDGGNLAYGMPATASRSESGKPADLAVDGDPGTSWSAGDFAPQWIEIDLDPVDVATVTLIVAQYPAGNTTHRVLGSPIGSKALVELGTLSGFTSDGDTLVLENDGSWPTIDAIRVETLVSPSWVAWGEIQVVVAH